MNRLAGILLILCFILPFAGSYFWLQHKKHKIRKEIKWKMIAGIDRKELVLLKFSVDKANEQLRWKHSKEFEFKGEMYDVVNSELYGDSIYYWCWWDHEETKLNRQLVDLVNLALGHNPQNRQQQKHLADFIKILFAEDPDGWKMALTDSQTSKSFFINSFYNSPVCIPASPPPEAV